MNEILYMEKVSRQKQGDNYVQLVNLVEYC